MIEGAIYVGEGDDKKVAIRYYQPVPKLIQIGTKEYVTSVQHGVSLVLVPEEEVPALLAHLGGCCGGQRRVFELASQGAWNVYSTGDR